MTPDEREAIQARADAATEGPWHHDHVGDYETYGCAGHGDYGWVTGGPNAPAYDEDTPQGHADAEFIAHARADIPALLAALSTLESERDTALAERDAARQGIEEQERELADARTEIAVLAEANRQMGDSLPSGEIPRMPGSRLRQLIAAEAERDVTNAALDDVSRLLDEARVERDDALKLAATCSCQSWPPDGPAADCAVHGAIRAFNEATAELAVMRPAVELAEEALGRLTTWVASRSELHVPYPDESRLTPYTRWLKPYLDALREALAALDAWRESRPGETPGKVDIASLKIEGLTEQERADFVALAEGRPTANLAPTGSTVAVPGLDAAIEAAMEEALNHAIWERSYGWRCGCGETGADRPGPGSKAHRHLLVAEVRAAAPHLVQAALLEAADAIDASCNCHGDEGDFHCEHWSDWLRERAARQVS